ncbi:MAG: ACT domain-containing protein [Spirochaetaceae bacterium]|nr:ACT domain-containing protein [Spirochaetaceae bacterium]
MSGEKNLKTLLKKMSPVLNREEYVFITLPGNYGDYIHLKPLCSFKEEEGLTLIVTRALAEAYALENKNVFKAITLKIHSSLNAVGLTAAVSTKLSEEGISANVVAAYYHDHIFVQAQDAERALNSLKELSL